MARDWTWHTQTENKCEKTEDEFTVRSSLGRLLEKSQYFGLQRVQPVTQVCDPTTVETVCKKKRKREFSVIYAYTSMFLMQRGNHGHVLTGWGLSRACRRAAQN